MERALLFSLERKRRFTDGDDIEGILYVNGVALCFTLENKLYMIPQGLYTVAYNESPKFGRKLPLIYNDSDCRPARGLRIHAGNSISDTKGCVLVGMNTKTVGSNPYSIRLLESKSALDMLCKIVELNLASKMVLVIHGE